MKTTSIDMADIDICMIVYNEEIFIEECLKRLKPYFQDVYILDMQSTDRTIEIARDIYGNGAHVTSQPRKELFETGFAAARNRVTATTNRPWVFHVDADEFLTPPSSSRVEFEDRSESAMKVTRRNLVGGQLDKFDNEILKGMETTSVEYHVRIYKKSAEVRWESFLHEELWIRNEQLHDLVGNSNLSLDHVSAFRPVEDRGEKELFYAWILMKMHRNPNLQSYVRPFYLNEYIPKNIKRFEEMEEVFAKKYNL